MLTSRAEEKSPWNWKLLAGLALALSLLAAALTSVLYSWYGKEIVESFYKSGRSIPLNGYINPAEFSLEQFSALVTERFWLYVTVAIPCTILSAILLAMLVIWLFKKSQSSAGLTSQIPEYRFRFDTLTAVAVYLATTILFFYPAIKDIQSHLIGPAEDNMMFFWSQWWFRTNVMTAPERLSFVSDLFFPQGASYYHHSWSFYNQLIGFGLSHFFSPITSYNITVLHTFPLAGLTGFFLARYLLRNSMLALVCGFIFAFSPWHVARSLHHINIAAIHFTPLLVLFYLKSIRNESRSATAWAALSLVAVALCDWYHLVFGLFFIGICYLYLALVKRKLWLRDVFKRSLAIISPTLVILSFWLIPMFILSISSPGIGGSGHNTYVIDVASLVTPGVYQALNQVDPVQNINGSLTGNFWEGSCYLGVMCLLFFVVTIKKTINISAIYVLAAIPFLILSFGILPHWMGQSLPVYLPDTVFRLLPVIRNVRDPGRWVIFFTLAWGVLVSISIAELYSQAKRKSFGLIVASIACALIVADLNPVGIESTDVRFPAAYDAIAKNSARFGILDMPIGYLENNRYLMYQTFHRLPLVEGMVARKFGVTLVDTMEFVDLEIQSEQLKRSLVKYIVVHKGAAVEAGMEIGTYLRQYELVLEDEQCIVLQVY